MFVRLGGRVGRLGSAVPNIERPDPVGRSTPLAAAAAARLHAITYKGLNGKPPDIVRMDYRWDDIK